LWYLLPFLRRTYIENRDISDKMPPKNAKNAETFFEKKHNELKEKIDKHLQAVQENIRTARARKADLIKGKASIIKHTHVRKLFLKLTKPADLERAVNAINEGTKMSDDVDSGGNKGQQWEAQYTDNLVECFRLIDCTILDMKKIIHKKEEEEKKLIEIQRKAEEFHNSCLGRIQELKTEGQKPFQITSNDGTGADYLYSKTPFQCYQ
jgi:hypothetical protein